MYIVTKEIKWEYAHRLRKGYIGNCSSIHGHQGRALITYKSKKLNNVDMVVDFKLINERIKSWINENWDHATLIYCKDKELIDFCKKQKSRHYIMPENATAEQMSKILYNVCKQKIKEVDIESVTVYETDTSSCCYRE